MHLLRTLARLCLLGTVLVTVHVAAEIYKCTSEGGGVEFTDRACADGERAELRPGTGLSLPPLSEGERAQLEHLERRTSETTTHNARAAREARARSRAAEKAQVACDRAAAALAEIRATRRRGYRLSEDAALRREETRQRDVLRSC